MSCVGSLRYRLKPKMQIAYVKILLTTKMIQHSKSMQKRCTETQFQTKKNRRWVFRRHCLAWFCTLGYSLLASCGTLSRCSRNPRVPRNGGWKTLNYVNTSTCCFSIRVGIGSVAFRKYTAYPQQSAVVFIGKPPIVAAWFTSHCMMSVVHYVQYERVC